MKSKSIFSCSQSKKKHYLNLKKNVRQKTIPNNMLDEIKKLYDKNIYSKEDRNFNKSLNKRWLKVCNTTRTIESKKSNQNSNRMSILDTKNVPINELLSLSPIHLPEAKIQQLSPLDTAKIGGAASPKHNFEAKRVSTLNTMKGSKGFVVILELKDQMNDFQRFYYNKNASKLCIRNHPLVNCLKVVTCKQ